MLKILLGLFLALSFSAFADDYTHQCQPYPKGVPLPGGYCIHQPVGKSSGDVLYYFHGRGGSELQWQEEWYYTAQIRAEWNKKHAWRPTVISISFGPEWLLAEKNSSNLSGLFEFFTKSLLPMIENGIGGVKGRRLAMGESMGGFNTTQLALKTRLFSKAAILCAPMTTVSPFSPIADIEKFIEQSAAQHYWKPIDPTRVPNHVNSALNSLKAVFPSEKDWNTASPVVLAGTRKSRTSFYVAAGFHDEYALYEGNEVFVEKLKASGMRVEWHPMWGGHCVMDIPSLARFLVR